MKELLGISIESLENGLLYIAMFFLALYLITLGIEKKPHWFLSSSLRECKQMEQKFQKLLANRRDVLHHFYWARSEGQTKKMKEMDKDLVKIDADILALRDEYHKKKRSLTRIVQKLM